MKAPWIDSYSIEKCEMCRETFVEGQQVYEFITTTELFCIGDSCVDKFVSKLDIEFVEDIEEDFESLSKEETFKVLIDHEVIIERWLEQ